VATEASVEIAEVRLSDAPAPLPGEVVSGVYRIALDTGAAEFAAPITLRLPYPDIDQNGEVDQTAISEAELTLWRYASDQDQWIEIPVSVVIPEANVVVADTRHVGFVALFRATNGSVGTVGSVADDVIALGSSRSGPTPEADSSWATMEAVSRPPYVTAWDTTLAADGDYELRAVCSADAAALAAFQTTAATPQSDGSSRCFIATAAYGSALEPRVQLLREFRDRYLLPTRLGQWLVDTYYRLSPPLADWIREHERLRTGTRGVLAPVIWIVRLGMGQAERLSYLLAGCLLLGIVGCSWYAARRRTR
jgi:hypothetical protein